MKWKKGLLHSFTIGTILIGLAVITTTSQASIGNKLLSMKVKSGQNGMITTPNEVDYYRNSGYAYKAGFDSGKEQSMWKIYEYNENWNTIINRNNAIYCLKAGVGFGSSGGSVLSDREYTSYADMKDPKTSVDRTILEEYKQSINSNNTIATQNYNAIVWILDHCYVPAPTNSPTKEEIDSAAKARQQLLNAANIPNSKMNDDIIDIVQQIAIWYFSNDDEYKTELIRTMHAKSANSMDYQSIEEVFRNDNLIDEIDALYDYFITNGNANKGNTTTNVNPISLISTNAKVKLNDNYYIAGPYKIEQQQGADTEYTLTATIETTNKTPISYELLDSNRQPTSKNLKQLVGQNFYIRIPATVENTQNIENAKFTITAQISQNTITYWTVASANNDQPVAEVKPGIKRFPLEVTLNVSDFDLSLRKFITKINNETVIPTREPVIGPETIAQLKTGAIKTVTKTHTKRAKEVDIGNTVLYTIRIYNEGDLDGYAKQVTDYLPVGLTLKPNSTINTQNGWTNPSGDGRTIVSTKLANTLIPKFDGTTVKYADIEIECIVNVKTSQVEQSLKNVAEITEHADESNLPITDRDSVPNNLTPSQKTNYNPGSSEQGWGYQDDDDYEELVIPGKSFDLALRKFISKINDEDVQPSREPVITTNAITALREGRTKTATKTHTKEPISIKTGDTILYTIRIYNEGEINGYAKEITDYLPEGLSLKPNSSINTQNGWKNPSGDGKTIVTDKLATRLLAKFNGTTLDYADVQVECIVNAKTLETNQSLKNIAEITSHTDENNQVIADRDSTPKNLLENEKQDYDPGTSEQGWGYQDDDDYEELLLPGKYFDLSLRKFITNINGKELVNKDGTYLREPTIDLTPLKNGTATTANYKHPKNPIGVAVGDIVIYTLRIYNEGQLDGYATTITDYLPPQLEFVTDDEENFNAKYGWEIDDSLRKASTNYLARTTIDPKDNLIKAFDGTTLSYKELKIKCRVKSIENLDRVITNIAEITNFTDAEGNVIKDRDSQKQNLVLPTDVNLPDYKGNESNKSILTDSSYFYKGQQDDDDFEKLILEQFDLALRKFITKVNDTNITNRVPVFTNIKDKNGNYIYEHTKEPVEVDSTDIVEYTIRIYNEGDIAGYAKEVKDNIPEGLEFLPTNQTNTTYRWVMLDEQGNKTEDVSKAKYITTDYLSKEQEKTDKGNLIEAFTSDKTSPDYKEVKVAFKVVALNNYKGIITNIAEISDDSDESGNKVEDKDSTPDNNNEKEDDIDKEHIKLSYFDLALRKFITAVNDTQITDRIPVFKIDENGKYVYEHTKEPVEVENKNIVTYTLRVYNEGTKDGYAKEIKDDLPEGLEFLPDNETNLEYRWVMLNENGEETKEIEKAVSIKTDYLSKEQEIVTNRDNLLTKFDANTMKEPDYKEVKIAFKVTEPNTSDRILINRAQISDDSDKDGKDIIDVDSTPDKWIDGEDDQDIEKVKVKYFDLSLRKWVTEAIVIDNGKETITQTGHKAEDDPEEVVKVELKESRLDKVVVKFRYKIRIKNEGEIAGYATEISDYIPEGLKFVAADNPNWKEVEGKIVTDKLKDTLLQPGDTAEVEVLLTWINSKDNFDLKVNVAEISKDKNDSDTPDIDSTPNNKKPGEDDIDDAPVILSVKTGIQETIQYVILTVVILVISASGVLFIKKYVL